MTKLLTVGKLMKHLQKSLESGKIKPTSEILMRFPRRIDDTWGEYPTLSVKVKKDKINAMDDVILTAVPWEWIEE